MRPRVRRERGFEDLVEFLQVLAANRVGDKAQIVDEFGSTDDSAHAGVELVVGGGDDDVAVGAGVALVERSSEWRLPPRPGFCPPINTPVGG